jgi:hypothetical protein
MHGVSTCRLHLLRATSLPVELPVGARSPVA